MREVKGKDGKVILRDRTESWCTKCNEGKYREMYFQDDMHGVLHCSECDHQVKRWIVVDKKRAKGFGARPPVGMEWQVGKTAASVRLVGDIEELINEMTVIVKDLKSGEVSYRDYQDIWYTMRKSK